MSRLEPPLGGWTSALAWRWAILAASGFSLSRMAVMSAMVRGGATRVLARPLASFEASAALLAVGVAGGVTRAVMPFVAFRMQACVAGELAARQRASATGSSDFPAT